MEKMKFFFMKLGILNLLGLVAFFFTLYFGSAGLGILLISVFLIIFFEYFFRFFEKGKFTPYLLMIFSPILLINYSSIIDFRIRIACFIILAYIITAARTPAAKKINFSLMKSKPIFVWLTAFAIFALASLVLYLQGIHLSGDEPHYIMISQSIVEDGDFDLRNNFDLENDKPEKTYFKYLPVEIDPHGGDYNGKFYSFHAPGVSFLLIPFYWLFGLLGGIIPPQLYFRLAAAFINAFFALGLFLLLKKTFPGRNISSFWLLFLAIFPLVFHCIHLYPELPAATLMMFGYIFAFSEKRTASATQLGPGSGKTDRHDENVCFFRKLLQGISKKKNFLLSGLFLSFIPWFHVKYIPPLVFVALIIIFKHAAPHAWGGVKPLRGTENKSFWGGQGGRFFKKAPFAARGKVIQLCCFFLFPLVSLILLMVYTKSLYGSINPANIFPSEGYFAVPILARLRTLFAYFFDQRDGMLFYAPLFFLAFVGLRRKFSNRGILLWTAVIYILFHANTTLRGAYSPAGRPLLFVSWIFIILIVNFYYSIEEREKSKAIFKFLSGLSVFILVWLFYYPLFVYQPVFSVTTERASGLLTFFGSSYFNLSEFFPSFLSISNWNYTANYVWIGLFAIVIIFHYFFSIKVLLTHFLKKREKIISFLLFLVSAFLLCFYPHIHLVNQNKFSNKKVSFFNNSKNFYYIEGREVFRIKAGNNYDIFFDLKRKGEDRVQFQFLNIDQVNVTVRNGNRLLFKSQEKEGRFSFRLSKLRKIKVKDKLVTHIGIETGDPFDKGNPFLFLKIE